MTPVGLATAIVAPLLTLIGVVVAAWLGAWAGRKAALKNADANAEASKKTSDAAIHDAITRAFAESNANWARYTEAWQKWCEHQAMEIAHISDRLARAEVELEATKIRAAKAEGLYSTAVAYLRRVSLFVNEHWPGEMLPPPPRELEADL